MQPAPAELAPAEALATTGFGFDELLAGYGIGRAGYDAIRSDVVALRLLIATDKVRWALERKPDRLPDLVEALQALVRGVQRT